MKPLLLCALAALALGFIAGYLIRGRAARDAELHITHATDTLSSASSEAADLITGLQSAQEEASDVTVKITDATEAVTTDTETVKEIATTVTEIQRTNTNQGTSLDQLESELQSLASQSPASFDLAFTLLDEVKESQKAQESKLAALQSQVTGLESSLRQTTASLTEATTRATTLDSKLSDYEKQVARIQSDLQSATLDLQAARNELASHRPEPIIFIVGAAAGLLAGLQL